MGRRLALAGIAALAGACDFGEAQDPRLLAMQCPPPVIRPTEIAIKPAVGNVCHFAEPSSMPMAESASASEQAQQVIGELRVVVGDNASASFDISFQSAFSDTTEKRIGQRIQSSDREAIELLMIGRADFGLIGGSLSNRDINSGLQQTQVGIELYALSVSPMSSVRSLSSSQVRQVFAGQVTNWQQLGFHAAPIVAMIPDDELFAERAQQTLMNEHSFASTCLPVGSEQEVADKLRKSPGAIGIVRVTPNADWTGHKLIQVDWTPPTVKAFASGAYKFGIPVQLVTQGKPDNTAIDFIRFAKSPEGRALLAETLSFGK